MCREFFPLKPIGQSSPKAIPVSYEFRTFWWKQKCVGCGKYWVAGDYSLDPNELEKITAIGIEITKRLQVTFLVIDFALTLEGNWIVIECNDGQDSGYAGVNPRQMWSNILGEMDVT